MEGSENMKICTVNVPEKYIEAISKLVGENGLFPSRSELIRVAVREFLLRALKSKDNSLKFNSGGYLDFEIETVKVPVENTDNDDHIVTEMRKYEDKKENGFVLKTRVLGTKEEWERSRQCISVPKDAREKNVALGPNYLTKYERY